MVDAILRLRPCIEEIARGRFRRAEEIYRRVERRLLSRKNLDEFSRGYLYAVKGLLRLKNPEGRYRFLVFRRCWDDPEALKRERDHARWFMIHQPFADAFDRGFYAAIIDFVDARVNAIEEELTVVPGLRKGANPLGSTSRRGPRRRRRRRSR